METSSRNKSSEPVVVGSNTYQRSRSPSERFCSSSISSAMTSFASSSSSSAISSNRNNNTYGHSQNSPSVRFGFGRSRSPGRSISVSQRPPALKNQNNNRKRMCLCSPTNHPGSFRCSYHKSLSNGGSNHQQSSSYSANSLIMRRSAMTNSLVRIGGVEGELVKRALAALIRPSSHQQRRRADFQPRPSRLSIMSDVDDL